MSTGSHRRKFSHFESVEKLLSKLTGAKKMLYAFSLVKYLFFYSADLQQIFLLVKKSITLLTCCINNYLMTISNFCNYYLSKRRFH
jgi:hypothetical protein